MKKIISLFLVVSVSSAFGMLQDLTNIAGSIPQQTAKSASETGAALPAISRRKSTDRTPNARTEYSFHLMNAIDTLLYSVRTSVDQKDAVTLQELFGAIILQKKLYKDLIEKVDREIFGDYRLMQMKMQQIQEHIAVAAETFYERFKKHSRVLIKENFNAMRENRADRTLLFECYFKLEPFYKEVIAHEMTNEQRKDELKEYMFCAYPDNLLWLNDLDCFAEAALQHSLNLEQKREYLARYEKFVEFFNCYVTKELPHKLTEQLAQKLNEIHHKLCFE